MSLSCLQLKNDPIHLVQLITEGSFAKKEYTSPLASESPQAGNPPLYPDFITNQNNKASSHLI